MGIYLVTTLSKGRRSFRNYKDEAVEPALINELINTAWHAPTGVNSQSVLLTTLADKESMDAFRDEVYAKLEELFASGNAPEHFIMEYLSLGVNLRKEHGMDIIFRGAPHLVIASSSENAPSPEADTHIFLAYFELMAQSMGLGTLWNGMILGAVELALPALRERLGVPADHKIGYTMVFGKPAVKYQRTVNRGAANVNAVKW